MPSRTIKGTPKMAETIRSRRIELGLTIEEAAKRAGVGIKSWCRYEAGESIREDKYKGICKALNLHGFHEGNGEDGMAFRLKEYKSREAWSDCIERDFGIQAAVSFVIGYEILLDSINEDLRALATMPRGSHVGQISASMLESLLPEQFLMRYDYDFLYRLKMELKQLRNKVCFQKHLTAHSVIEELLMYLIVEESEYLMESMKSSMLISGIDFDDAWKDWIFVIFDDMDVVTFLYSDLGYLPSDHAYHFDYWMEAQFYLSSQET